MGLFVDYVADFNDEKLFWTDFDEFAVKDDFSFGKVVEVPFIYVNFYLNWAKFAELLLNWAESFLNWTDLLLLSYQIFTFAQTFRY